MCVYVHVFIYASCLRITCVRVHILYHVGRRGMLRKAMYVENPRLYAHKSHRQRHMYGHITYIFIIHTHICRWLLCYMYVYTRTKAIVMYGHITYIFIIHTQIIFTGMQLCLRETPGWARRVCSNTAYTH